MLDGGRAARANGAAGGAPAGNRLLRILSEEDRDLLAPHLTEVPLTRGQVLFEAGDNVTACHFPCDGAMVSLVVALPDGTVAETATVGREGAIGGIVSLGHKPAFARAAVQVGGTAIRIDTDRLEEAKARSASLRDVISRYADCLIAQVLQSAACNVLHGLERRFCRWLLTTQDRAGRREVALTQEFLAEMLGVQRTTVTATAASLQARGIISYSRGRIAVVDRGALETASCDCYAAVVEYFDQVLPGVYPHYHDRS